MSFNQLPEREDKTFDQSYLTSYGFLSSVPNGRLSFQVTVGHGHGHGHG